MQHFPLGCVCTGGKRIQPWFSPQPGVASSQAHADPYSQGALRSESALCVAPSPPTLCLPDSTSLVSLDCQLCLLNPGSPLALPEPPHPRTVPGNPLQSACWSLSLKDCPSLLLDAQCPVSHCFIRLAQSLVCLRWEAKPACYSSHWSEVLLLKNPLQGEMLCWCPCKCFIVFRS